jgi:membrane-bound serine protease (ClpP class)
LLLFIEIILLPGFGAAGIPGVILIGTGIGWLWITSGWELALLCAGGTLVIIIPLGGFGLWYAPRTKLGRMVILDTDISSSDGFQAQPPDLANLVGKSGQCVSPLRPAGIASIEGQRVDVVTRGEFVEPDTEVEVISVEGRRVVVRSL